MSVGTLVALMVSAAMLLPGLTAAGHTAAAPTSSTDPGPATAASSATRRSSPTPTSTAPLSLLGFGDSVMAGAGCDCDDFLAQVADGLQRWSGIPVRTTNNGANGATTTDVLADLRSDGAPGSAVARADVIVLTIGANDLGPALSTWSDRGCTAACYQPQITDMADRLNAILSIIDAHKKPNAVVLVTNYWNVYEDGSVGDRDYGAQFRAWSDAVTRRANTEICQAAGQASATCVDTYRPFKADGSQDPTDLLAGDGDHPNEEGTTLIAKTVLAAAEARLRAPH